MLTRIMERRSADLRKRMTEAASVTSSMVQSGTRGQSDDATLRRTAQKPRFSRAAQGAEGRPPSTGRQRRNAERPVAALVPRRAVWPSVWASALIGGGINVVASRVASHGAPASGAVRGSAKGRRAPSKASVVTGRRWRNSLMRGIPRKTTP